MSDAAGPGPGQPVIALQGVGFRYPDASEDALSGVDLALAAGAFVAVLGGNGSGKSTLAQLCNGLLLPCSGTVRVAGLNTADPAARTEVRRRVGLVFQNPDNQIVAAVVEDDVAFGPENLGLPPADIGVRVAEALAAVGMSEHARRDPHHLSGGQKQRVAIAGVLAMRPDCVCLDEPTSLLDPRGRADVAGAIRSLHALGHLVLLITHHAAEATSADRVLVLERGRVVADGPPRDVLGNAERLRAWGVEPPPMVAAWTALRRRGLVAGAPSLTAPELAAALGPPARPGGDAGPVGGGAVVAERPAAARHPARAGEGPQGCGSSGAGAHLRGAAARGGGGPSGAPAPPLRAGRAPAAGAGPAVALAAVRYSYPDPAVPAARRPLALDGVDLRLAPGECVALMGATGSGKSSAALLCCALLRPDAGTLDVDGLRPWAVRGRRPRGAALRAVRRLCGLVFQHPEDQFFEERVLDEIAFAPRNFGAAAAEAEAAAREALVRAGLPLDLASRSPFHLSGGQMRRVAIAAILAARPRYLVLDEPTAGLDAGGRASVTALVRELRAGGAGVLLITHRMEEAAELADRALVMHAGRIVAGGPIRDVFALGPRLADWDLEAPAAVPLLAALRGLGWAVPDAALTMSEALEAIAAAAGGDRRRCPG